MKAGIEFHLDTRVLEQKLYRTEKNLAYTASQALNDTAYKIQADTKGEIKTEMHVRKEAFTLSQVKVKASNITRGILEASVGVYARARSFLPSLVQSQERPNFTRNGKPMADPVTGTIGRPSQDAPALNIKTLRMKERKGGWKGKSSTFIIPGVGVFQRTGPGSGRTRTDGGQRGDDISLVFGFIKRAMLPKKLPFFEIAKQDWQKEFRRSFLRRIAKGWNRKWE